MMNKKAVMTLGNDYLFIYNGLDTNANLIGVYTGTTDAAPQPGTFVSSKLFNSTDVDGWKFNK